ncbi:MAG: helix-turn-helix domain-containing protein, partial [Actinomycetota bacterium]|nr:helix-turn-helix domain-containing protein [Actinomycetota bacterium]
LHAWQSGGHTPPGPLLEELEPLTSKAPVASKKFQWHRLADRQVLMMDIPTHANALLVVLPNSGPHPDAVVLLHAATVLGLEMSRTVLSLENQRRLGAEFLLQALDGRLGVVDIENRLPEFGIGSPEFVIISMSSDDGESLANIHVDLWRHGYQTACLRRFNTLHLAVASDCTDDLLRHTVSQDVRIGISRPARPAGVQRALQESIWALGTALDTGGRLVRYADGPSWLGLTSFEEGNALVQRLLGPIFEYEKGEQGDLILTLKTFLDTQRSWQKTAAALFAHRQTIIYRIRKIGELTGLNMTETSTLAQLWFALQIHEAMGLPGNQRGLPANAINIPQRK